LNPPPSAATGTLPLDDVTVAALRALRDLRIIEAIDASLAYAATGFVDRRRDGRRAVAGMGQR